MSRSSFITTKETDIRYHHGLVSATNRSNENSTKTTSINRHNPKIKRNLRDKRRATGIRPNDVPLVSTSTEVIQAHDCVFVFDYSIVFCRDLQMMAMMMMIMTIIIIIKITSMKKRKRKKDKIEL